MVISRSVLTFSLLACAAMLCGVLVADALVAKAAIDEVEPAMEGGGGGYEGPTHRVCEGVFCRDVPDGVDEGDEWADAPFRGNLTYAYAVIPVERGQVLRIEEDPLWNSGADLYVVDTAQLQLGALRPGIDWEGFVDGSVHVYHHRSGPRVERGVPPDAVQMPDGSFEWDGGSAFCGSEDPMCEELMTRVWPSDHLFWPGPAIDVLRIDVGPDLPAEPNPRGFLPPFPDEDEVFFPEQEDADVLSGLILLWVGHADDQSSSAGLQQEYERETASMGDAWLHTIEPDGRDVHAWFVIVAWVLGVVAIGLTAALVVLSIRAAKSDPTIGPGAETLLQVAAGATRYLRTLRTTLLGTGVLLLSAILLAVPVLDEMSTRLALLHGASAQRGVLLGLLVAGGTLVALWLLQVVTVEREIRRVDSLQTAAESTF